MAVTIFYSWQSDLPNSVNRSFIEDALKKAVKELGRDDMVDPAIREESISVDKDTQGLPGSPAIVDSILEKISKCAIFVSDLTFVGKSEKGRLLPNPNVLIEYGYAQNALGNACILKIVNTHYGVVTTDTLPFDMRHLKWPLTYNLSPKSTTEQKKEVKTQLVKDLKSALAPMLINSINSQTTPVQVYEPFPYTSDPSNFLDGFRFGKASRHGDDDVTLYLPSGQRLFLRLIPNQSLNLVHAKDAFDFLKDKVGPMGASLQLPGHTTRNRYGAISWLGNWDTGEVGLVTQLFMNGELWGIDAESIQESHVKERSLSEFSYFPIENVESTFIKTMKRYLDFAISVLNLTFPLKYYAGATNVEGYRLGDDRWYRKIFSGRVDNQHIYYTAGHIETYDDDPTRILLPFFKYFWNECGLDRPDDGLLRE